MGILSRWRPNTRGDDMPIGLKPKNSFSFVLHSVTSTISNRNGIPIGGRYFFKWSPLYLFRPTTPFIVQLYSIWTKIKSFGQKIIRSSKS